jgi:hypothetical protein
MADALLDFASLDSAAAATETTTPTVDTEIPAVDSTATEVDTPAVDSGVESETHNADGSEKTPEETEAFKTAAAAKAESDKSIDTKTTPDHVRKALKVMRDTDPKNAGVVKELHGSFERWNAAKAIFPKGVQEMQDAKAFIDTVGGPEGYQKMQESLDAITATDELLYAADPKLWDNVIEDLKASGHPEALGALAPSFMSKLKAHDSQAYYDAFTPHFLDGLKEVHMDNFVGQFNAALNTKNDKGEVVPDINKITGLVKSITDWYKDLEATAKPKDPVDSPERKKFLAEKTAFEKTQQEAATQKQVEFNNSVGEACDKYNNQALGKHLGTFLRLPYFKDFPYETKVDLGNGIKDRAYATLKADATYQAQMKAMWKQKNPDRAKIEQYHKAKMDSIAESIVRTTVQSRYPNYAKGGSAAGRVAAATVKKAADTKAATVSVATGKPIYVATRPDNLVREPIKIGNKEYSAADLVTLQIMGRGYVRNTDGKSYRFVTWRK